MEFLGTATPFHLHIVNGCRLEVRAETVWLAKSKIFTNLKKKIICHLPVVLHVCSLDQQHQHYLGLVRNAGHGPHPRPVESETLRGGTSCLNKAFRCSKKKKKKSLKATVVD